MVDEFKEFSENVAGDYYENENPPSSQSLLLLSKLDKNKKLFLIGFFFIGFGVILLGFFQLYNEKSITVADVFGVDEKNVVKEANVPLLNTNSSGQDTRFLDTDGDGLSDYDETSRYGTSPYLEDTDSDGVFDKQEIEKGENPNCPKGKSCTYTDTFVETDIPSPFDGIGEFALNGKLPGEAGLSDIERSLISGKLDGASLRKLLIQDGVGEDLLSQVSDDQLIELYQLSVGQIKSGDIDPQTDSLSAYENLSVSEVRSLMLKGGMSNDQIKALSDDEIMKIFNNTLTNLKNEQN